MTDSAPPSSSSVLVPNEVHFVGSVPLPTTHQVFTTLNKALPGRLKRIPDGEVAERQNFTIWQIQRFAPLIPQTLHQYGPDARALDQPLPTPDEVDAVVSTLKDKGPILTDYDTNALSSWSTFQSLQSTGDIPSDLKFQVSLPTPLNSIALIRKGFQTAVEPFYEATLLDALHKIESAIPHNSLSIQWDIATEFAMLEGSTRYPQLMPYFSPVRDGVIDRLVRLVDAVSPTIDLGLHLCYGDIRHTHFCQPKDMGNLVDIAQTVKTRAARDITYIHMPVPKDRVDPEFFAPLKNLELGRTALYLGVVHYDDLEGTKTRIATASKALDGRSFGVATECGMGRTPAEHLESILQISAAVTMES